MSDDDRRRLRDAFGAFPTGVTVVTACDPAGHPVGFTANSFSSVSLDPPMLLVCPGRSLSSFPVFEGCSAFAVNVLAEGQEDVSNTFAAFKGDRFARVGWRPDARGCPLIEDTAAAFSCDTAGVVPAGDHIILLGAVVDFVQADSRGLGYVAGQYFSLGLEREAAAAPRSDRRAIAGAIIEHEGRVLLEDTGTGLRPPRLILSERGNVRAALSEHLARHGLEVRLGKAYSIFDDRASDEHFTYFLAQASRLPASGPLRPVPIAELASQRYISRPHATMLTRFALEHATRDFGLYVGDDRGGDIHSSRGGD